MLTDAQKEIIATLVKEKKVQVIKGQSIEIQELMSAHNKKMDVLRERHVTEINELDDIITNLQLE